MGTGNTLGDRTIKQETHVYALNGVLAAVGALVFGLILLVNLIIFVAIIAEGQSFMIGLLITAACLPFYIFGYYFIHRNNGAYQLTDTHIFRVKGSDVVGQIAFDDVQSVQEKDWHIPPNLVLKGSGQSFRINRQVDRFGLLYDILSDRIPAMQMTDPQFPLILKPSRRFYREIGILLGIFGSLFLFMSVMAVTSDTEGKAVENVLFLWGLYLFIAIIILITAVAELKLGVARLTFDADVIKVNYLIKRRRQWNTSQIKAIRQEQYEVSYKGIKGLRQMMVIEFDDGKSLKLADADAGMFGTTVEQIRSTVQKLYSAR